MDGSPWFDSDFAGDQDTIFISIADLFSLLSLAIIFVAFTSTPAVMRQSPGWEMVRGSFETGNRGAIADRREVYIEFARSGGNLMIEESWNGRLNGIPVVEGTAPGRKLSEALGRANPRRNIYVVISPEGTDSSMAAVFVNTLAFLRHGGYTGVRVAVL